MMAMEEEKNDDWGDFEEFYADDEELEEYEIEAPVYAQPQPQPRPKKRDLEKEYQEALAEMRNAQTDLDYSSCSTSFYLLHGYKDSKELYEQCERTYKDMRQKELRRLNWLDASFWVVLFVVIVFVGALLGLGG